MLSLGQVCAKTLLELPLQMVYAQNGSSSILSVVALETPSMHHISIPSHSDDCDAGTDPGISHCQAVRSGGCESLILLGSIL